MHVFLNTFVIKSHWNLRDRHHLTSEISPIPVSLQITLFWNYVFQNNFLISCIETASELTELSFDSTYSFHIQVYNLLKTKINKDNLKKQFPLKYIFS